MDLSHYILHALLTDDEFVLYRGRERTSARSDSLKPGSEHPRPESIRILRHEYSLRTELDSSWAVRSIELIDEGRTMLVFEDPGGEPLNGLLGTPMELGEFLRIAIGVSAALGCLHGKGLVHKDIKPANIMIEQATARTWLMGFGLASRVPREHLSPAPPETIASTLAYMAPEQTGRMNHSVDARSDLYALGVTFYTLSPNR